MEDWTDPEYVRMRQRRRGAWIIGGFLHALLFGVLVIWPYFRGDTRGRDSRLAFGRFAACLYGGQSTGEAGIALPKGDLEHFAAQYLEGADDWPARCRPLLAKVTPDDAFLLFPSVRRAEADLRQEIDRVDDALAAVERTRRARGARSGRVPERPLEAVTRLMAALSEQARTADPETPRVAEVIRFASAGRIPEPARVPLNAASDAVVTLAVRSDGVELFATDARGMSRTRVGGGRVSTLRVRRSGLVRGLVPTPTDPWAVFAMSAAQCAEDQTHCARRAGGVVPFDFEHTRIGEPRWIEAHPWGRADRSVWVGDEHFDVLSVAAEGEGAEVRRFAVSALGSEDGEASGDVADGGESVPEDAGEGQGAVRRPPAAPIERIAMPGFVYEGNALLLAQSVVWSETVADGGLRFVERITSGADASSPAIELAVLDGEQPWSVACDVGGHHVRALGTTRALRVVARGADGVSVLFDDRRGLAPVLDPRDPHRDRVRLACDAEAAALVMQRGRGPLLARECDRERCDDPIELPHAAAFDAVRADGHTVVAWLRTADDGAVRVTTLGDPDAPPRVVAACFSNDEGFCGYPMLAERNGRIVLGTRERADVRALESTDAGRTFEPMGGIR